MTREEVKAALKSYRALKREHDDIVRRREEIEASILGSPRLDGMPHGASVSNPTANIGAALAELSTLYDGKARQLAAAMILVEDMIDNLDDPTQRMIARLYYIDGLTWEQVCVAANYSWRQTHRIHAALLAELSDEEEEEGKCQNN